MTVSRKSKQVKDKTKKLKNKKLKNKKEKKNVTIKLQHVGGGPIDFIQWIFGKIVTLFTFDRIDGYETMNIHPPQKKGKSFYLIKEESPSEDVILKSSENVFRYGDRNNPGTTATVSRRFKLR